VISVAQWPVETWLRAASAINVPVNDLLLPSSADEMSWAIWQLPARNTAGNFIKVQCVMHPTPGSGADVAHFMLADYSRGRWEYAGSFSSEASIAVATRHLSALGNVYLAAVTASGRAAEIEDLVLSSANGWSIANVATGVELSLAMVDGRPAFANYVSRLSSHLLFAASSSELGALSSDWHVQFVDGLGPEPSGMNCSLALIDGIPAISYTEESSGDLKYARAAAADGSGEWTIRRLDYPNGAGSTNLAFVEGRAVIAFHDTVKDDAMYARSANSSGMTGSWQFIQVATIGDRGSWMEFALVGEHPALLYYNRSDSELEYARSDNASGVDANWELSVVADGFDDFFDSSLAVISGKPAVSYYDSGADQLAYARAGNDTGIATTWERRTIDATAVAGTNNSLAELPGGPAIAYSDVATFSVMFAQADNATGLAGEWQIEMVDRAPTLFPGFGHSVELINNNGIAAVAYASEVQSTHYAVRSEVE
jgi:hypothetical protein